MDEENASVLRVKNLHFIERVRSRRHMQTQILIHCTDFVFSSFTLGFHFLADAQSISKTYIMIFFFQLRT